MRRSLALLSLAAFALALAVPALPAHAASKKIFELTDPRGDDAGDGTIRYPLNYYDLKPGALDIVALSAKAVDGGTEFEATFAKPVVQPDRRIIDIGGGNLNDVARYGFFQQNLDIYIDTDRVPGSGGLNTLPGRNASIAPDSAWERVVCLTPRPNETRSTLKRLLLAQLRDELDKGTAMSQEEVAKVRASLPADIEDHVFFPTRVRVVGSKIRFFVPDLFLGGKAKADWSYVIFTSGADIDSRFDLPDSVPTSARAENMAILPIAPGGAPDRFGGKRDDDYTQPPILDLIVPPGERQESILRAYDPVKRIPVTLHGVVPAAPAH